MSAIIGWFLIVSSLGIVYLVYDGFGRLLRIIVRYKCRAIDIGYYDEKHEKTLPRISVILAVYNEEDYISAKIRNLLDQCYPEEKLQIIVVDDGSTDETARIAQSFPVTLIKMDRGGVSRAHNAGVRNSKYDIIVFSDCKSILEPEALTNLVVAFRNPKVGCVTAQLYFRSNSSSALQNSQGKFWSYELDLRNNLSKLGLLATCTGSLMATRKQLWRNLHPGFGLDCVQPLVTVEQGSLVVQVKNAITWDSNYSHGVGEFRARVRMTVRNLQATFSRRGIVNPFHFGWISVALWFHKIFRWMTPVLFLVALLGGLILGIFSGQWVPIIVMAIVTVFGLLSVIPTFMGIKFNIVNTFGSFFLIQLAFLRSIYLFLKGISIESYDTAE